jgi:hypothetical protein
MSEVHTNPPSTNADFAIVEGVASLLHEAWRHTCLQDDGTFTPLYKPVRDEQWIAVHHSGDVDIANTFYSELPGDAKAEHRTTGEIIVNAIAGLNPTVDPNDPDQHALIGAKMHDEWLRRNHWAKGGALDVPFDQLPTDAQARYLQQLAIGLTFLRSREQ